MDVIKFRVELIGFYSREILFEKGSIGEEINACSVIVLDAALLSKIVRMVGCLVRGFKSLIQHHRMRCFMIFRKRDPVSTCFRLQARFHDERQLSKLLSQIDDLEAKFPLDTCDLTSLLTWLKGQLPPLSSASTTALPPEYSLRLILVYGRSHTMPVIENLKVSRCRIILTSSYARV